MNRPEVGPNAIGRLADPLLRHAGREQARAIFASAGLEYALAEPPKEMVPEQDAATLFAAVCGALAPADAEKVLQEAGRETADYVMAHRIPAPVRWLLPRLPRALAMRMLLQAIARHAWTFAGSGVCRTGADRPAVIEIENNPLATPGCPWHRAVFLQMMQRLVATDVRVEHVSCCATGSHICRFEIHQA